MHFDFHETGASSAVFLWFSPFLYCSPHPLFAFSHSPVPQVFSAVRISLFFDRPLALSFPLEDPAASVFPHFLRQISSSDALEKMNSADDRPRHRSCIKGRF